MHPRYNVAPTQDIPVVKQDDEGIRSLSFAQWGLIPSWSKDAAIGNKMINARAETVAEKPAFRSAFKHCRCLIPASGYYGWKPLPGGRKQPYYIHSTDGMPLTFAGLWEHWQSPDGRTIESCSVITTQASVIMAPIHDRMPVILPKQAFSMWLDYRS